MALWCPRARGMAPVAARSPAGHDDAVMAVATVPSPKPPLAARIALVAIPVLLALLALDRYRATATYDRPEALFEVLADRSVSLDDVVLGSSHAARGVDARLLGPGFWNLGLDGAGPRYLRDLYGYFRTLRPAPRRAVVVLPWFSIKARGNSRLLPQDAEFLPLAARWDLVRSQPAAGPAVLANVFPLLKQRERLLQGGPEPVWAEGYAFRATRGYAPFTKQKRPMRPPELQLAGPIELEQTKEVVGLLEDLRADGVRVAIVHLPTYLPLTPPHVDSTAFYARTARERKLPRFDYERDPRLAIGGDPADFRDWGHALAGPSARISRRLAADLEACGFTAPGRP